MKVAFHAGRAGVAAALFGMLPVASALAADLTVTAYGGAWEKAYRTCFVQPFEKASGKTVDVILGGPMQWINQVAANPARPPIDVMIGLVDSGEVARNRGLVDPVTPAEVPNLAQLKPNLVELGGGYGFPIAYGSFGLMYDTSTLKDPPKTWREFIDGTLQGKWEAALPGIGYVATPQGLIGLFAHLYGGDLNDIQPGMDQIKRLAERRNVTFYSEPNSPLVALRSGEIDIAMYFDGRAWTEHDASNPNIGFINPAPGSVAFPTMVQKVKNGSPLAYDFMNVIASVEGQTCFANAMQYNAANSRVQYSEKVAPRIAKDDESLWLSFSEVAAKTPAWVEAWNKQIGR